MKVEQRTLILGHANGTISQAIVALAPGQCLRLTTAREGRSIAAMSSLLRKRYGFTIACRSEGDDVLVFKLNVPGQPTVRRSRGRPRHPIGRLNDVLPNKHAEELLKTATKV